MLEVDRPLEDIVVEAVFLPGEVRLRKPERRCQPLDEGLRIGHLRATGGGDVGNQPFERVVIDGGVFPGHG